VGIGTEIIDIAGAGHNGDNAGDNADNDGSSEEERSQILLTPRRANQGVTMINVTDSSTLDEPSATNEDASAEDDIINPNEIIHDFMENTEDFDKYQTAQMNYVAKKEAMLDKRTEVTVGKGAALTTWNVVDDIMETDLPGPVPYFKNIGITVFDFADDKDVKDGSSKKNYRTNLHNLVIHMWPGDWKDQLEFLNGMIESQQLVDTEEGNGRRKMMRTRRVSSGSSSD